MYTQIDLVVGFLMGFVIAILLIVLLVNIKQLRDKKSSSMNLNIDSVQNDIKPFIKVRNSALKRNVDAGNQHSNEEVREKIESFKRRNRFYGN